MHVSHLECSRCRTAHPKNTRVQTCEKCLSPLLVRYDLDAVKKAVTPGDIARRPPTLWRYRELLPLVDDANIVTFGEGMTPLIPLKKIGKDLDLTLLMKDESLLPTGCFKARGAAVGVSMARELGVRTLIMPTAGNAGGAWSSYCVPAGISAVIVMPQDAQDINKKECVAAGAKLFLVNGIINDAGKIVAEAVRERGWYDASTLKEPYRIEGKKTMGLEIVEQLGWRVPDVIVYPTGGGVGIIAIYKALLEMRALGWIGGKLPRLVAVQSGACAPIPKAWEENKPESEYWPSPATTIPGLRVPKAIGDFLILKSLYESRGCAVAVPDAVIYATQRELALREGRFICPEGASTLAAARELARSGWIEPGETVVLLNTASGLKYPETVAVSAPVLEKTDSLPEDDHPASRV